MCGPPGAGKTMLARRLPGILPELDDAPRSGRRDPAPLGRCRSRALSRTPPFEAPHHTRASRRSSAADPGCVRPGAIARATEGILFLDEAGEFQASALDALRQPLETGAITIHRAGAAHPSRPASSSSSPRTPARAATTASAAAPACARRWRSADTSGGCPARCWIAWTSNSAWRASRSPRRGRAADGTDDGCRGRARRGGAGARGAPAARHAVAPQRPRSGHVAARGPARARAGRAPPARCRAAPRRAHTARATTACCASRGRSPISPEARAPPCTTSAARSSEEGDRAMTDVLPDPRDGACRARPARAAATLDDERARRLYARAHVELPHRAGRRRRGAARRGARARGGARRRRRAIRRHGALADAAGISPKQWQDALERWLPRLDGRARPRRRSGRPTLRRSRWSPRRTRTGPQRWRSGRPRAAVLWVRGEPRCARARHAVGRPRRRARGDLLRRARRARARRRPRRRAASRSSRAARTASTAPHTARRIAVGGTTSRCSRAARTGRTPPATPS